MERHWPKYFTLAAIALLASCDAPQPLTAPANAATEVAAPRMAHISGYKVIDGPAGQWVVVTATGKPVETHSAIIDARGGTIRFDGTELSVPRNAVTGPTRFTITVRTQPYLTTQLSAVALVGSRRHWTDGEELHTFNGQCITLSLKWSQANSLPDLDLFKMLWVLNDQAMEVEETTIQGHSLVSRLWHFTDYTPAIPRSALEE